MRFQRIEFSDRLIKVNDRYPDQWGVRYLWKFVRDCKQINRCKQLFLRGEKKLDIWTKKLSIHLETFIAVMSPAGQRKIKIDGKKNQKSSLEEKGMHLEWKQERYQAFDLSKWWPMMKQCRCKYPSEAGRIYTGCINQRGQIDGHRTERKPAVIYAPDTNWRNIQ